MPQRAVRVGSATVVAMCVLGACTSRPAPAASPAPTTTTTTTTTTSTTAEVDTTDYICQLLDAAEYSRTLDEIAAISGDKPAPDVRRDVSTAYAGFANELTSITMQAGDDLRPVLSDWTAASNEVAAYIAGSHPGPDIVVDYGPSLPRWQAAKKAAEGVCGHELPRW